MHTLRHPIAMFFMAVLVVIGIGVGVVAATTMTSPRSPTLYQPGGSLPVEKSTSAKPPGSTSTDCDVDEAYTVPPTDCHCGGIETV
jgi:hypothetical protein